MIEDILSGLADNLGVSLEDEFAVKFLESMKGALPASREVMEKDFKSYADKLSAQLKEDGHDTMNITLAFQSWATTWMASQMTLISGLLLMAVAAGKEIENASGIPKSPLVP